ncbi:MAG: redoxin family protein [Deltaproteobacteria bacterium]|nr:redoxin family protein [Deltaproteobacteria bacterium]
MKMFALYLFGFLALSTAARADDGHAFPTLPVGSTAPDFSLPGVDGKNHTLKEFASAKVLAIVFTTNHCPTSQAYEDRLKKIAKDYQKKGVTLVAISPSDPAGVRPDELGYTDLDDNLESMKIRARDRKFNFPYLYAGDKYQGMAKAYGPTATPHAFVFDAERKLRYVGRIDDSERVNKVKTHDLRNAIDALLAGKPVAVAQNKAFGCSTKWAEKSGEVAAFWDKVNAQPVSIEVANADVLKGLRKGKPGVVKLINVWATWCGPCAAEFPDLMNVHLNFKHRDFELITVAAQFPDEQPAVLKFLKKHHAATRNLIFSDDDKYKLMEAIDPKWDGALPYTLLIDPSGKVLYRKMGGIDFLQLRRALLPALDKTTPWSG